MALNDFKKDYILRYQDILSKVMVSMKSVGNTRFEPNMKFGDTVTRFVLDLSNVRVRSFTNLTDQTVDPLGDSTENMTINVQVGAVFPIARLEKIQAGPLNPAMEAGKQVAIKVAQHLDAVVLAETRNGFADFDTGNLTTSASNGTPITLSSTTVPQMVTQTYAKLFSNNASMTNLCWVLDPFSISQIAQYPIGKDLTNQNTVFINGFSGNVFGAEVYASNNLTGEAVLTSTGSFTDTQTITIGNGAVSVTFTTVTAIGSTAGNVLIGANAAATLTNLAAAINNPSTTSSTQVALSAADQIKLVDILGIGSARPNGIAAVATATTLTIVGLGSSRLVVTETQTNASWTSNFIHCYYGMKGAVDVAVQDQPEVETRDEAKQLTTNIFNNVVAAVKTYTDGTQKFLDVLIAS